LKNCGWIFRPWIVRGKDNLTAEPLGDVRH
jgi:hypothetical protein